MTQPPEYPGSNDPSGNEPPSYGQSEPPSYPSASGSEPPSYGQPPTHQSYGQQDHGQQQYGGQPPGNTPYGAWQGGNDAGRGTNGTSIAAFILNLTPCGLVIPGWICAIIGLRQIKRDGSKGRWAAITSLVMGVIWAIVIGAMVAGGVWLFNNIITPSNAEVGQCVNLEEDDGEVSMLKKDCSDDHDAEIVVVGEVTDEDLLAGSEEQMCRNRYTADGGDDSQLGEEYEWNAIAEDVPPESGDKFVCIVELSGGGKLDSKVSG